MAKPGKFQLKIGEYEVHQLTLTPRDAARATTRIAKGTFDKHKSMWDQPKDAQPGRAVRLLDETGAVLMACRPTMRGTGYKTGKNMHAACDITPKFKTQLRRDRKKPKRRR